MSRNATDNTTERAGVEESDRYAELTICGEEFVVYDRENHQAWIQSTVAVSADDIR
jgi:hypothetical protein